MSKIFGALFLACFFAGVASFAEGQVVNGSFESAGSGSLASGWQVLGNSYTRVNSPNVWDQLWMIRVNSGAGAVQKVTLNQTTALPVSITVAVKGQNIADDPGDKMGASLDCKIAYRDGSFAWCPITLKTKSVGTFDWKWVGYNSKNLSSSTQPIDWIEVRLRMGNVAGQAWFDDVHVEQWNPTQNGLVTLMFDDSLLTTYMKAFPLLSSHGFAGTSAAVSSYIDSDSDHMTLSQLRELEAAGWSVVSHTVTHADLTAVDVTHLNDELYFSHKYLVDNGFTVKHLALPFGAYNALVFGRAQEERYAGLDYESVRTSDRGFNPQGVFPYNIRVQGVISSTTLAEFKSWLNTAKATKSWLVLILHEIDRPNDIYTVTSGMLSDMAQAIADSGLPVVTYDDGFHAMTQ
ncbi:polysaccharide deacetylase family protein [Candidatus Giovannonibacteria bacterium]|nr:polysaccharide deacetylase family protein [Candidatus Giovannonibacteria bacterium]